MSTHETTQRYHNMDLIVGIYIFCILVSELMGGKTFPLGTVFGFHLNASVAIFLLPLIFTINDAIVEVYGAARAKSLYRTGIIMIIFLALFSAFALWLPASARFAPTQAAYTTVFGQSLRITLASLIAFAYSDFLDILIFAQLRKRMQHSALWLRNNLSNIASTFIDTFVFMTLAFYAFDKPFQSNMIFLTSLILPYWLLKVAMSFLNTPFVYAGVTWLRKAERI